MCGITGICYFNNRRVEENTLKSMTRTLRHRGPDSEGYWIHANNQIGFGHRRLAIIDLSPGGHQPMHFNKRYTITFNGEIYNFVELKDLFLKKGYLFQSTSDTEVLMAAYDYYGYECAKYLDGQFAFAIWDDQKKELFCARDRFGEKPFFFWHEKGKHFLFASEMKALFDAGCPKDSNDESLYTYLQYDLVENPAKKHHSFFQHIQKLENACSLIINQNGHISKHQYWHLNTRISTRDISETEATEKFRELFSTSINRRLRSDVMVGSSLSGGLDSSSIVCMVNEYLQDNTRQKTFTARFHDKKLDEWNYVEILKNALGLNTYYTFPDENSLAEDLDKVWHHQEEPFGSSSIIAQWEVMKLAKKENVIVLLDGQGGDEILGGYHKYFHALLREKAFTLTYSELRNTLTETHQFQPASQRVYMTERIAAPARKILEKLKRQIITENPFGLNQDRFNPFLRQSSPFILCPNLNKTLHYDLMTYGIHKLLRFADRNSMAHSREVRLPLLFHELVEFVFSLPAHYKIRDKWSKYLLRKSMDNLMPKEICWRVDKTGFETPQQKWLENNAIKERIEYYEQNLLKNKIIQNQHKLSKWKILMTGKLLQG